MKDILNKIYREKLLLALLFTDDYYYLKRIPGVLNILLTKEFINKFLSAFIYIYGENKRAIPTVNRKNSLLMILSDIRFEYKFKNESEKRLILDKVNRCISIINLAGIKSGEVVCEENNFKDKTAPTIIDINFEDLSASFCFFLVHYYLQNDEKFKNEAIPLFCNNIGYYISNLYDIIDDNEQILKDRDFLRKTKDVVVSCISFLKENSQSLYKEEYKVFMKELNRLNRLIK